MLVKVFTEWVETTSIVRLEGHTSATVMKFTDSSYIVFEGKTPDEIATEVNAV